MKINREINDKRQELIRTGLKYGFIHPKTLKCSRELDHIILKSQKFLYR